MKAKKVTDRKRFSYLETKSLVFMVWWQKHPPFSSFEECMKEFEIWWKDQDVPEPKCETKCKGSEVS